MIVPETLSQAMKYACEAARRWLGSTYPNPPVGALALDSEGNVLAAAAHEKTGSRHAEAALIDQCTSRGILKNVHTLVVTLSPCNHSGQTPPCCDAIISAGIRNVVIGAIDPNPAVKGNAVARLRRAGVNVTVGVEEEMCRQLIYAFAYSVKNGRPWVTVKRAFDARGLMIPPPGQKTFTSAESLRLAHLLRKRSDAILTGSGTVLADNPSFTVRHASDYKDKKRVLAIIDRRKRVPKSWLKHMAEKRFIPVVYDNLEAALGDLGAREVREVLVEAGPLLSQAIIKGGFWTMDVVIQKADPDQVKVTFNPKAGLFFDAAKWQWANVLPE